jgi:hypothetical protein
MKRLLALGVLLTAQAQVLAQGLAGPDAVPWNSLTPNQRAAISQLEGQWNQLTPAQQHKWLEVANRLPSRSASEQERTQQRMGEWSRLAPQDRAQSRANFQELRGLSREERQQQWGAYQALPPDQRRALAERAASGEPNPRRPLPLQGEKSSVVQPPVLLPARPVGPTVVQRGGGVTTELVSRPLAPPLHQQAGLPKVVATPGFVDSATLLPQRGAQGAAGQPAQRGDRRGDDKQK